MSAGATRGSALRGAERGEGVPASDEPGCGAEPHLEKKAGEMTEFSGALANAIIQPLPGSRR